MKATIRKIGNSRGVLIPKRLLAQAGLENEVEAIITVEDHAVVLRPARQAPRAGGAEASRRIAEAEDDPMVWPEFDHAEDEQWQW
jgi:antitoxin MazE